MTHPDKRLRDLYELALEAAEYRGFKRGITEAMTVVRETFPRRHTWASENSDRYTIQDETIAMAVKRLKALIPRRKGTK
jgi:hypothetical protein